MIDWNPFVSPMSPPSVPLERQADELHAARVSLATIADGLRKLAALCPGCVGRGQVPGVFVAYTMTDDPRLSHMQRRRKGKTPRRYPTALCSVPVPEPCLECYRVRQLIEIAEGRA